ncbi:hypothetical protein E4J89_07455 [Arthrobacter sp. CAU 1506]|uniref:hypothetical protein n=1 Tax=Arthrobacter sp. CAU 1506 TaxID=2560052 RepID=UPI0010ABDAF6|nr:hypothetical protein [Arthrobacter sp. CAU 1506]TJY70019.1 hypothetical protein E4J89_07455 [Arthrobacter sp. CAU 1506]
MGSVPAVETPLDSAMLPAQNPKHSREEILMKPLDAALAPAPERSIGPTEAPLSDAGRFGHGQLISAGSLRDLDAATGRGDSVSAVDGSEAAGSLRSGVDEIADSAWSSAGEAADSAWPSVDELADSSWTWRDRTVDSTRPAPEHAATAGMPNFLDRQEVNAMIRKLRQSVSLWKRIQNVRVDDQLLEQVRDDLLSHQQLIR